MNVLEHSSALEKLNIVEQLQYLVQHFPHGIKCSTSFGIEDQLITHHIFENNLPIEVFTLDTGRLFQETYATWNATLTRYQKKITPYFPPQQEVEKLLKEKGPNSFYESVEQRKECCHIRKVIPLQQALSGTQVWITGLRQDQSQQRQEVKLLQADEQYQLLKFQPLWNWTFEAVKTSAKKNNIVLHPLHSKGFPSIGCMPCTRAIQPGEDVRAGRWWWEDANNKECGLHIK